jgi:hypothetical protein
MQDRIDAANRVGAYMHAWQNVAVGVVGSGHYGLVSAWDDGTRTIVAVGFESAIDAETVGGYLEGVNPSKPAPSLSPQQMWAIAIGMAAPIDTSPRTRVRFEVVVLDYVVPATALDALQRGAV